MDRPNRPAALAATPGLPPQAQATTTHSDALVTATLPSGDSVEILLHGATVTSWKSSSSSSPSSAPQENLWLSTAAKLDGSKPVRGGIPLVFPVFGSDPAHAATSKLPQHGFARNNKWEFLGKSTSEGDGEAEGNSVKLDFGLSAAGLGADWREKWPYDFGLVYSVTLSKGSLTTSLVVSNEGEDAFECQALLHTYLRVKDINATQVTGLESSPFTDKVDEPRAKTQSGPITFSKELDRVYAPSSDPKEPVAVVEGGSQKYKLVRDNLPDVVVWNPWVEKAGGMGDFEPKDGWKEMVCVEAGSVRAWTRLEKGDVWEGAQTIYAL